MAKMLCCPRCNRRHKQIRPEPEKKKKRKRSGRSPIFNLALREFIKSLGRKKDRDQSKEKKAV